MIFPPSKPVVIHISLSISTTSCMLFITAADFSTATDRPINTYDPMFPCWTKLYIWEGEDTQAQYKGLVGNEVIHTVIVVLDTEYHSYNAHRFNMLMRKESCHVHLQMLCCDWTINGDGRGLVTGQLSIKYNSPSVSLSLTKRWFRCLKWASCQLWTA